MMLLGPRLVNDASSFCLDFFCREREGSHGGGTFVTEVVTGGPADVVFKELGIDLEDGLRFKTIGQSPWSY